MRLARHAQYTSYMNNTLHTATPPDDLELAIQIAEIALDIAERGRRAPSGEVSRLRSCLANLRRR